MADNRILSNIPYSVRNYSNYAITAEETRRIVDVPYFPAQNLVEVQDAINLFAPEVDYWIPYKTATDHHVLLGLFNRPGARFLLAEIDQDARMLRYAFVGSHYPQSREDYTLTYDGSNLYIFGGYADGRCLNDFWKYNIAENTWTNLLYSKVEKGSNEIPSRRRKANIVQFAGKFWIFGGETDVLSINSEESEFIIPLNDVWRYDPETDEWTNFDPYRRLPHRPGHIVEIGTTTIKIVIVGGTDEWGTPQPTAVWTLDLNTGDASYISITPPFTISHKNVALTIDGVIHYLVDGKLYRWNSADSNFELVNNSLVAIHPETRHYWQIETQTVHFGDLSMMDEADITVAKLYDSTDSLVGTYSITLPPRGLDIPSVNVGGQLTFSYAGMINGSTFNERTFITNHATMNTTYFDFPADQRPTERAFPAMAYDKYRNRVWLFGGFDGSHFYNDLWYFDLNTYTWVKVHDNVENTDDENPSYPPPRQKAGMAIVADDWLYIIGGSSDVKAFSDFWKYHIPSGSWTREFPVDATPWGSQHFIFEWRDRLWLYNGNKLYRYFYAARQWVVQPFSFRDTGQEGVTDLFRQAYENNEFLNTPITCKLIGDFLFIQNDTHHVMVRMTDRLVTNLILEYDLRDKVMWLTHYLGLNMANLASIYHNISELSPLTKNQTPHSFFYKPLDQVLPTGGFIRDFATNKWIYVDRSGLFEIQDQTIEVDKANALAEHTVSAVGHSTIFPDVDWGDPSSVWSATIDRVIQPQTYLFAPWFLYNDNVANKEYYRGAQAAFWDQGRKRSYIVYRNGNVLKYNPKDNTFFVYFTRIWEGAAIGFYESGNKIYAFGGIRGQRRVYAQSGLECPPLEGGSPTERKIELSHCGLLEFDLNINQANVGSIESYLRTHNVSFEGYTVLRDYLLDIIHDYIEGYATHAIPASIDEVRDKIYQATQPLLDDLSQFDMAFEQGTRPLGRAYSAYTQIGERLYIFGGAQCYKVDCTMGGTSYTPAPWCTTKPGTLEGDPFNPDEEARKAYVFNMQTKEWVELAPMPQWRYLASAIASPDGRFIYIVGGFTGENCTGLTNSILRYDTQTDSYIEIQGIPQTFAPRARPVLQWLDNDHLLIMYGFRTELYEDSCDGMGQQFRYLHIPIGDAWVLDLRNWLMYKAFEDTHGFAGIVARDLDNIDENAVYIVTPGPELYNDDVVLNVYKWNLVDGTVEPIPCKLPGEVIDEWSLTEQLQTPDKISNFFRKDNTDQYKQALSRTTPYSDGTAGSGGLGDSEEEFSYDKVFFSFLTDGNIRFRYAWVQKYGPYDEPHLFIVGELLKESGLEVAARAAAGHEEAHLRIWKVNLNRTYATRYVENIPYEYPLPVSPVVFAYDGKQYLYVIYNKYNIWRLNFKQMLEDPSGSWWDRLPPCINCNFLGDDRTDPIWQGYVVDPGYLVLVSKTGLLARMSTDSFTWFADKTQPPASPVKHTVGGTLMSAALVDQDEVYLYKIGGISGKVLNIFDKQWDNFFFDLRNVSKVVDYFGDIVDKALWPVLVKRRRLYIINHLGHVYYAWLRLDGKYDIEFQLQDFYHASEIRIYGDYEFLNQAPERLRVQIFTVNGTWIEIPSSDFNVVINEAGWDYEGDYIRRYRREFVNASGDIQVQYSFCPPNYVQVPISPATAISKVRVSYSNEPQPYNYVTRINKVEVLTDQTILALYDSPSAPSPMLQVDLEPITIGDDFTAAFAVYVRNNGTTHARDVIAYVYGNKWVQFTDDVTDPDSWRIADERHPFQVATDIPPGTYVRFYVRGVNIDLRPHINDLVVKGVYAGT